MKRREVVFGCLNSVSTFAAAIAADADADADDNELRGRTGGPFANVVFGGIAAAVPPEKGIKALNLFS